MTSLRIARRAFRASMLNTSRPFSSTTFRFANANPGNAREHDGTEEYRKHQTEKPLNPHMTNTNSTIVNEMPSAGAGKVPPEFITSADGDFTPKDSVPENTERMTGGTQDGHGSGANREMAVGEMEGAQFRVEPLRRDGEHEEKMRARLLYQSRKRGTLESDLLMSTFADAHLPNMTAAQMVQYDQFLDENDWDIYYWVTQEPSQHLAKQLKELALKSPVAQGTDPGKQTGPELETDAWRNGAPRSGEWAQTIGTFKPAYRPVPRRWQNSEILAMLRKHVISRSAGGVHDVELGDNSVSGKGMAFMPPIFQTDQKRS
ncbi:TPR repeat protein [Botrytis cinerea]